jgi:speckle-type POZ protein
MAEHCKISATLVSAEGSYVLKVDGYSRTKAVLKNGEFVISTPFRVGGHSWAMRYYPNGNGKDCANFISLYLLLKSAGAEDVHAKCTLSVLDTYGARVPSFSRTFSVHTFTKENSDWGYTEFMKKADLEGSVHLRDDCLTIKCDVTIVKEIPSVEQSVVVPPSDLHRHLGDLLKNKDAADLNFQVGGERFSAHRCVLAARSPVFKAELLGAMKENSGSPIEIRDMEADVFKSLLHFIYTDTDPPVLESVTNKGDVVMAGHLLVAADRYNIARLKLICEEKLCNRIDSDMVATTLALAEQHGFHGLKEACLKFLASPSNLEAMMASDGFEHLKSSCPSVLKELIARILPAEQKAAKDLVMAI